MGAAENLGAAVAAATALGAGLLGLGRRKRSFDERTARTAELRAQVQVELGEIYKELDDREAVRTPEEEFALFGRLGAELWKVAEDKGGVSAVTSPEGNITVIAARRLSLGVDSFAGRKMLLRRTNFWRTQTEGPVEADQFPIVGYGGLRRKMGVEFDASRATPENISTFRENARHVAYDVYRSLGPADPAGINLH